MRAAAAGLMLLVAQAASVSAQPAKLPVESVTVTGLKDAPPLVVNHFVQSFAKPSYLTGKMGRWENGICPVTTGLAPKYAAFISQRVRELAAQVNAPVNRDAACRANVEIVFTTTPQDLLDTVRRKHRVYLGYFENLTQADRLAQVKHPIQAWYLTATKDLDGKVETDSLYNQPTDAVAALLEDLKSGGSGVGTRNGTRKVTGGRLRDGVRTIFQNVIVAAEPPQLKDYEVGTLADYIAMLALTQLNSLDVCQQQLPSIINLLARDCAGAPHQLSESDLGYLKGLYSMSADGNMRMQQDGIAHQMKQTFRGR
ncbi:MAG: hypothetical protein H0U98_09070 [Alphaproteobacteria bacterium]|nr:hypothetical protein [Alphaproteobacteria bacterium]